MMAHYRCKGCGREWKAPVGQGPKCIPDSGCIICGSLYVEWENYDAWYAAYGKGMPR